MEKTYFLAPDADSARRIVADFRTAGIADERIHAIANADVQLEGLPEASVFETTDYVPALKRGAAVGGTSGLLAGLVAVALPPAGIALGGGALLATTLAGASFGAWASSVMGASVTNSHLREFQAALDRGNVLILAEIETERLEQITQIVHQHHPEAAVKGVKSALPPVA